MTRFLTILCFLLLSAPFANCEQTVLVTLKLTKVDSAPLELPVKIQFPATCSSCVVVDDQAYARQNAREVILAMRIPLSTSIALDVATDPSAFRRVTL